MHIGKMMARMNPRSPQLGAAGGGKPELETTDIAGALAFVPAGLGRELLCRIWAPDMAALNARDLDRSLMDAQAGEWRARMDRMVTAQLAVFSASTHASKARASAQLEAAKAKVWPVLEVKAEDEDKSRYEVIRGAVLFEISSATLCRSCSGRGSSRDAGGRVVSCDNCNGVGIVRISDRGRAKLLDRDESTYRRWWKPVYEWTLQHCQDAYGPAHRAYCRALETD